MLQPVMTPAVKFALSYPKQRISLFALFLFMMYFPDLPPCHSQVVPPGSKLSSNAQILDASTRTLSRAPPFKEIDYHQDVKRYLNVVTISRDGPLVVRRDEPFASPHECIVIPRAVIDGFLSALHVKLNHPSRHRMKLIIQRYFFALVLDKALDRCSQSCHLFSSLKNVSSSLVEQSTSDPPEGVGISFAADVMKRYRQLILVVRETSTSYTAACLLNDECRDSIRAGLLRLCLELRPLACPPPPPSVG